ncbi:Uncharacterised protein [Serratia quinivorans]|uniref:Uncharacterized protein n=1 Tax=Serratia quinivorans TaxID=137545 RepID=A0A380B5H3_9GAMM|nr:Uncharacterised protein [Serratia quinivorans]SUI92917.1 Uncharacterised protein [Serratia quinivorans]
MLIIFVCDCTRSFLRNCNNLSLQSAQAPLAFVPGADCVVSGVPRILKPLFKFLKTENAG